MADDYEYDGDEFQFFDNEWIYVEDEFALPDELAEMQIADPGYGGTNYEIQMESSEYDLFGFWDDLEYADDPYWEYGARPQHSRLETGKIGQKRKRSPSTSETRAAKTRLKPSRARATALSYVEAKTALPENVVFKSQKERCTSTPPPLLERGAPFALLGDWRHRFTDEDEIGNTEKMPAEMQQAAQAQPDDTSPKVRHMQDNHDDDEGEWVGEEDGDDEGVDLTSLDPDMLKAILRQKLGEAGLGGANEATFMASLSKMLAGDDDEAAGELANTLLGQATADRGGDNALSGWLSQQGVSLDESEEGEEASSEDTPDLSEHVGENPVEGKTCITPSDNGISVLAHTSINTKQTALHGGSRKSFDTSSTSTSETQGHRKGKQVTIDGAPFASSESAPSQPGPKSPSNEAAPEKRKQTDLDRDVSLADRAGGPVQPTLKRKAPKQDSLDDGREKRGEEKADCRAAKKLKARPGEEMKTT